MRATLVLLATLAGPGTGSASGAEPSARVTTDSLAYCAELAERLAAMPGARGEPARALAAEGLGLCEKGHTRAGIAKLRRAFRAARAARAVP